MSDWRNDAACIGNPHPFEPDDRGGTHDWRTPRAICNGCPVRQMCLDDALAFEAGVPFILRWGMRGGMTPGERVDLEQKLHPREEAKRVTTAPCGTVTAYRRHKYRREPICQPCRDAANEANRARKARLREQAVTS
jgi:WhiB family transcriptional regulator, redox-sensing transcriptional regulator